MHSLRQHEELLVLLVLLVLSDVPLTRESRCKSDDSKQFLCFVALIFLPILDSNLHYHYILLPYPQSAEVSKVSGVPGPSLSNQNNESRSIL